MTEARFLVGIDLGTSNCAMAFAEPGRGVEAPVLDFALPQWVRPGEAAAQPLLPSCLYLPAAHEGTAALVRPPWEVLSGGRAPLEAAVPEAKELIICGELARWQGARVPGRLVSSAKSWLCHDGVDREAAILPWGAPAELKKLSPVQASARLLAHLAGAWDAAHPEAPLRAQEVVLTVPASFDEAARALTVTAARQAGLEKFTLLEEPQAAFYDFTARHRNDLAKALEGLRLVLIVDVGGGTSDFTLVQVGGSPDGPLLRRLAVGEHLMLGGDNMDVALSRRAEERMLADGHRLSVAQWSQLAQMARQAKEALLGATAPEQYNLSLVAEGSRLLGRALSTYLTRAESETLLLDGFFPCCGAQETPRRSTRVALQEMGLPYAQDPAITRHLAAFLRLHAAAGWTALEAADAAAAHPGQLPRPDAILLNGGVFNSPRLTQRLVEAVSAWWPERPPISLLRHESLELAVARGAAFYGLVRHGLGRRISGGAAHALYVGLDSGKNQPARALCIIPRGQEEGQPVALSGREFQLAVGRPVRFPLFSSTSSRFEKAGDITPVEEDMRPLPPIHTLLQGAGARQAKVPVHLTATLTEIGTLELACVSNLSGERWRLEFELRGTEHGETCTVTESMPATFGQARHFVELFYGGKRPANPAAQSSPLPPPKDVKQLWGGLERALGPREEWRPPVLRELWGALFAGASRRRRSAEHERVFFQLLGFTLRPGLGYPLDEWRCEQSASLLRESVQFHQEKANWKEFWILWRRIAGGLSAERHAELWTFLKPHLAQRLAPKAAKAGFKAKGIQPEGLDEMVRLAGALEHLEAAEKTELGQWIALKLRHAPTPNGPWAWALGRLGARAPLYGSTHKAIAPAQAAEWVQLLLEPRLQTAEGALFALSQMARRTGDRSRDLEAPCRQQVLAALERAQVPDSWRHMVAQVVGLEAADKARALGDTLPVGLSL